MIRSRSLEHRRSPGRSVLRGVPLAGALVFAAFALTGCSTEEALRFGWPEGISSQAHEMRKLWTGSVIAALVVGVVVWGLIFWVVVRYRKRGDELPVQTKFNLPIEILYTVLPFLIIAVLFYYTATVQSYVTKETKNPDVRVLVVASKWNWTFVYPGVHGVDDRPVETVGTTEEIPILVIPKGKKIRFTESSNDVIHSFWVPELLFKRDVIPGRLNSFEITAVREGSFVGRCAELCGTYHANMNFELRVVSEADYEKYLAAREIGTSNADALRSIGGAPYATTTKPFDTRRNVRSFS